MKNLKHLKHSTLWLVGMLIALFATLAIYRLAPSATTQALFVTTSVVYAIILALLVREDINRDN